MTWEPVIQQGKYNHKLVPLSIVKVFNPERTGVLLLSRLSRQSCQSVALSDCPDMLVAALALHRKGNF